MGEEIDLEKELELTPEPTKKDETIEPNKVEEEAQKKAQHLENLNKAIREGNEVLRNIRKAKKDAKDNGEDEELPQINLNDPSSKAWDKHMSEKVLPVREALEKEREEIFQYALKEFIKDKPVLLNNAERRKAFLEKYDRLKASSGRTREGVLTDLDMAFGAEFSSELRQQAESQRIDRAQADALFSEPAVTTGSSASMQNDVGNKKIILSEDDKRQLLSWGMTPEEYVELKKKYN